MANNNLFYQLYSKSNNVMQSGYVCQSAIDEADTSFDISGDAGVITDSNGNTLASIDMSQIHADGLTQYTTETKIIQPGQAFLIQGPDLGLAKACYYYYLPDNVKNTVNWTKYVDVDFDIIYNQCQPMQYHVAAQADGKTDITAIINNLLAEVHIDVAVSLQSFNEIECYRDVEKTYLVFQAGQDGFFYYIKNLRLTPEFQSPSYPDSPFSHDPQDMDTIIIDYIIQYHPVEKGQEYIPSEYVPDCVVYKWLRYNYPGAISALPNFKKCLKLLDTITPATTPEQKQIIMAEAIKCIQNTCYMEIINVFDTENLHIIEQIVEDLQAWLILTKAFYEDCYWLPENPKRRVSLMKYPNGACRGLVIIPEWPTNYSEDFQYSTLWVNHVKSTIRIWEPNPEQPGCFCFRKAGVVANATLLSEQDCFSPDENGARCSCMSNGDMNGSLAEGWNDQLDTNDPYAPSQSVYDDMYMGRNCYPTKKGVIGLYKYMGWVNENKLWTKIGEAYMIIGRPDNPQAKVLNLIPSTVIYNPNPVPIRIKYMIFA